jgi:hypothetical protein
MLEALNRVSCPRHVAFSTFLLTEVSRRDGTVWSKTVNSLDPGNV